MNRGAAARLRTLVCSTLVGFALTAPVAAQNFQLGPYGHPQIAPFGGTSIDGYWDWMVGQTFKAPGATSTLDSFSFFITDADEVFFTVLAFSVYPVGPDGTFFDAIYSSPFAPTASYQLGWNTISGMNAPVVPGASYIAAVVMGMDWASFTEENQWWWDLWSSRQVEPRLGIAYSDQPYKSGFAVWAPRTIDPWPVGTEWEDANGDMAFSAVFTTTAPEPVSVVLLGTGLAGLAAVRLRRRKQAK